MATGPETDALTYNMRFPYHQIEDDRIERVGSIQSHTATSTEGGIEEDSTFCPTRPLLKYWPFLCGCCQIVVGFLCVSLGAVQVFGVPFMISVYMDWSMHKFNCYGAAMWSGLLLVLSGSCAVRAAMKREITAIIQYYVLTVFSFLANLALMILILWCFVDLQFKIIAKSNDEDPLSKSVCDVEQAHKYSVIALLAYVCCLLGCLLLFLSTTNYFCPVMFGEVQLMKKLGICWLPCCFYDPQKIPSTASSHQCSDDSTLNVIV